MVYGFYYFGFSFFYFFLSFYFFLIFILYDYSNIILLFVYDNLFLSTEIVNFMINCFYYNYDPPTQFQYFTDIQKGGSPYSDYCPWIDPSIIKSPDYESVCWDIRGNNISFDTKYMAEIWGSKSRCTKIIATNGQ
eukprot:132175_1